MNPLIMNPRLLYSSVVLFFLQAVLACCRAGSFDRAKHLLSTDWKVKDLDHKEKVCLLLVDFEMCPVIPYKNV